MFLSVIVLIISFILDGMLSIYESYSIFGIFYVNTIFSVIALVLIYPYFNHDTSKYLKCCIVFGVLYDVVYTNTLLLYSAIFFLLGITIKFLYGYLSNNFINGLITTCITIFIFYIMSSFILFLVGYISFDIKLILLNTASILLINIIFYIFTYYLLSYISSRLHIKHIN
jgi:cell shape-determining protein MreD